jgi:hypothetical protein
MLGHSPTIAPIFPRRIADTQNAAGADFPEKYKEGFFEAQQGNTQVPWGS